MTFAAEAHDAPATPFAALADRLREIRASERSMWRKLLDVYATCADYDPVSDASRSLFRALQDRVHVATHGLSASALLRARASADAPFMGLRSWAGAAPRLADAEVAKNYLTAEELALMHRIVHTCLDVAELRVLSRRPLRMEEWLRDVDALLRIAARPAAEDDDGADATSHVREQYGRWRQRPTSANRRSPAGSQPGRTAGRSSAVTEPSSRQPGSATTANRTP